MNASHAPFVVSKTIRRRCFNVPLLLTVMVGVFGCAENLSLREPYNAVPFSVYGVLSPDLDTQSVRLYVPEDFPTLGSSDPLDVDVSSTDLHTGESRVWLDTVLVDPNGQHEYVYWSPFQAAFGHAYRVEVVRRSDGATSYAEVQIPEPVTVRIDDTQRPLALLEVYIDGEDFQALKPEAVYTVDKGFRSPLLTYSISYQGQEQRVEQGWLITLNMIVDATNINYRYNADAPSRGGVCRVDFVTLQRLEFHVLVGDGVWNPPGRAFETHLLAQPQTLSNVENGFGFIGGGYRVAEALSPSREAVEAACFLYSPL